MRADLDALFQAAAILVAQTRMSDEAAGATLVSLLSAVAKFDHVVVFAYRSEERPIHVFSTFDEAEFDIFVSQYLVGPYLLDPFYRNTLTRRGGVWRMRELAPDVSSRANIIAAIIPRQPWPKKSAFSSLWKAAYPW